VPSGFALDDAAQGSADKEGIVDRAGSRRELAHGDTKPGAAVHLFARLHQQAGLGQLAVNRHPRAVFGMKNVLPRDRGALAMRSSPAPANFAQFQRFR
jgi:hypothetical protein